MRIILYCCLLLVIAVSCHSPKHNLDHRRLEQLADRSCRAITIRQQRYALADKMRFTQDTLGSTASLQTRDRLQKDLKIYLKEKGELLKKSLELADTIRSQLDSLMPYNDKTAQKRFGHELDSLIRVKMASGKTE